jgi:hypothetical protein
MTNKLRALTEDRQLRALMEEHDAAPPDDKERVLKAFIEKAGATYPAWKRTVQRSERSSVILRAMFDHCVKTFLAVSDLAEFERARARQGAVEVQAAIEALQHGDPRAGEIAFKMATTVLFMALDAGLDRNEVEKLRKRMPAELGKRGGDTPKKEKPWRARATKLAQDAYLNDPKGSDAKIATAIFEGWPSEKRDRPIPAPSKIREKLRDKKVLPAPGI